MFTYCIHATCLELSDHFGHIKGWLSRQVLLYVIVRFSNQPGEWVSEQDVLRIQTLVVDNYRNC